VAIGCPHATQKRTLRWLMLPQAVQETWSGFGTGSRGAKLMSGASGRCDTGAADLTTPPPGGGFVEGASAVAARGEAVPDASTGGTPRGGVGAATRGASR
jgi:hypothetical protein